MNARQLYISSKRSHGEYNSKSTPEKFFALIIYYLKLFFLKLLRCCIGSYYFFVDRNPLTHYGNGSLNKIMKNVIHNSQYIIDELDKRSEFVRKISQINLKV